MNRERSEEKSKIVSNGAFEIIDFTSNSIKWLKKEIENNTVKSKSYNLPIVQIIPFDKMEPIEKNNAVVQNRIEFIACRNDSVRCSFCDKITLSENIESVYHVCTQQSTPIFLHLCIQCSVPIHDD